MTREVRVPRVLRSVVLQLLALASIGSWAIAQSPALPSVLAPSTTTGESEAALDCSCPAETYWFAFDGLGMLGWGSDLVGLAVFDQDPGADVTATVPARSGDSVSTVVHALDALGSASGGKEIRIRGSRSTSMGRPSVASFFRCRSGRGAG
jgi:hypothetical protein